MSRATIVNAVNNITMGNKRVIAGAEVARLVLIMRKWERESLMLEGLTEAQTVKNIEKWLNDFRLKFSTGVVNANIAGGYGGALLVNRSIGNVMTAEEYLNLYINSIKVLSSQDLTRAVMLERSLAKRWKKNYKEFYNVFNETVIEGKAIGLTLKETIETFRVNPIYTDNVSLIDSAGRKWDPDRYAEMYSRTRSSEMETNIIGEEMTRYDMDVVQVSSHNTSTPICMQYEGRYFSRTGNHSTLPALRVMPPFHPNCLHTLIPKESTEKKMESENRKQDNKFAGQIGKFSPAVKKTILKQEKYNIVNRQRKTLS